MNRQFRWVASVIAILLHGTATWVEAKDVVRLPVPYIAQPDDQTCLPTSLAMAMHFMGRCDLTTQTIYSLHKRTQYDRYNVPSIAANYGLYALPSWLELAWTRKTVEAELLAGRPVILGLDCSRSGHFVLAVGFTDDGKVIIHDPYWKELGWPLGGAYVTTDWSPLIWRNGIMLRTEPWPTAHQFWSGTLDSTTAPRTMESGETTTVEFLVKNNGRSAWPAGVTLQPVDAYSSATAPRVSPFQCPPVGPLPAKVLPGQFGVFQVPFTAPQVLENTTFRENFNLRTPDGKWFSDDPLAGPSNREVFVRLAVVPRVSTTKRDIMVEPGSPLPWNVKFGKPQEELSWTSDSSSTTPTFTLRSNPLHGFNSAYTGSPKMRNGRVEASVWCDYQPTKKDSEAIRVGVFMRDSGQHWYTRKTELENGDSLVMCYDSDDGRLRCGNFAIGGTDDYVPKKKRIELKASGWHHFAITAIGSVVRYELDGALVHEEPGFDTAANAPYDYKCGPLLQSGDAGVFISTAETQPTADRRAQFRSFRLKDLDGETSVTASNK